MKQNKIKPMTLQELTTRLQSLCHDGYSQNEVLFLLDGFGIIEPRELQLLFKSDVVQTGFINVNIGE